MSARAARWSRRRRRLSSWAGDGEFIETERKERELPQVRQRAGGVGGRLRQDPVLVHFASRHPWTTARFQLRVHRMADSLENLGSPKNPLQRTSYISTRRFHIQSSHFSRSHLQPALKSKSFNDRMVKTTKALAIKKLQAELKEEKQAEIQRCVACRPPRCTPLTSR